MCNFFIHIFERWVLPKHFCDILLKENMINSINNVTVKWYCIIKYRSQSGLSMQISFIYYADVGLKVCLICILSEILVIRLITFLL